MVGVRGCSSECNSGLEVVGTPPLPGDGLNKLYRSIAAPLANVYRPDDLSLVGGLLNGCRNRLAIRL